MRKIVTSLLVVGIMAGAYLAKSQPSISYRDPLSIFPTPSGASVAPTPLPIGLPVKLSIPAIEVEAAIERVGIDSTGRMAAPAHPQEVGWYQFGPKPGEIGQAVIDGHLDTATGSAVFMNLKELKSGDEIIVTDQHGVNHTFSVYDKKIFTDQNFPLTAIFGPSTSAQLNLITCAGSYIPQQNNYVERLVILSQLEE